MGDRFEDITLAAVQAAPAWMDRDATVEKALALIAEAGAKGAALTVFGETWIPGYASFGEWPNHKAFGATLQQFVLNAVEVPSPATDALCAAARKAGTDVVIGVAERDSRTGGSVYCTLLFIGADGSLLGKHRKLKPTMAERTVWGEGDGSSLRLYDRPYGRLGGLNCWEHQMVLPGYALIAQGLEFHAAAWPGGHYTRQEILCRAFAMQSAAYVVMAGGLLRKSDMPDAWRDSLYEMNGSSAIIGPDGSLLTDVLRGEEGIVTATANRGKVMLQKMIADHAGHYTRPDVFTFRVNRRPKRVAIFNDGASPAGLQPALSAGIDAGQLTDEAELRGALADLAPELAGKGAKR